MRTVLETARRLAEPRREQTRRAHEVAADLCARLEDAARERGLRVRPRLVGSLAKDTHLADPLDIDVFVLFPPATPRDDLERLGIALGQAVLPQSVLKYAEHPYVHGTLDGFPVDVVPAYKLRSPRGRLSAVDRTPFHTEYVSARATARHRREIRLFKLFLRGIGCYGAETATGGVSGYLAELLVLHHGTLLATLRAVRGWTPPVRVSLGADNPRLHAPLVVVDPVDPTRNAAAAVRTDTLTRMRRAADDFLERPRITFFRPRAPPKWPADRLRRLLAEHPTVGLEAPWPSGREDARMPQAQRLLAKGTRELRAHGFTIPRQGAYAIDEATVLLLWEHEPARLPATVAHFGPPVDQAEHARRFVDRWRGHPDLVRGPSEQGGRWHVVVRRRERSPARLLDVDRLLRGFPYAPDAAARVRVLAGAHLVRAQRRRAALTRFLADRDPWQW